MTGCSGGFSSLMSITAGTVKESPRKGLEGLVGVSPWAACTGELQRQGHGEMLQRMDKKSGKLWWFKAVEIPASV